MAPLGDGTYIALKYNVYTGESWELKSNKWVKIPESNKIPSSLYSVEIVATGDGYWSAIRLDMKSGRSWKAKIEGWTEIKE